MFVLIDAHGPDHGLSVVVDRDGGRRVVKIRQWSECDEPDERGSYSPHIQEATVELDRLFDKSAPHYKMGHLRSESMHDKVLNLALNWLGYWGGEEEHVDDSDCPCDHFGMNYSGIGKRRTEPWPSHMVCDTCKGKPE